jgi:hypothetical protein
MIVPIASGFFRGLGGRAWWQRACWEKPGRTVAGHGKPAKSAFCKPALIMKMQPRLSEKFSNNKLFFSKLLT